MSVVVFPAALLNPQPPLNIVFDYGADASGVADSSNAWGRALAASAEQRRPLQMPTGTYLIGTGPGSVVDADVHDCPEVNYDYIDIEAIGGPVTLKCVPFATAAFPSQNISNSILKAKSSTGGTFRLRGDFVIDGAITTTPTLSTGADPEAQVPLEIIGYDTVKIEYLEVKNCYGNRDTRCRPGSTGYDAAADGISELRRGGLLIDDCGTVNIGLHVGQTWREGPFITNGCINRNISFSYAGPASFATGRVSSPLNPFGRVAPDDIIYGSEARDVSTVITVNSVTGAWGGSFMNVGWTGTCVVNQLCEIEGAIGTSGSISGTTPQADADNWGPGWDFGAEINPEGSGALTLNGVRMRDNLRYSAYLNRTEGTEIASVKGDIEVNGGWWGPRITFVEYLDLTVKVRDVVRYYTGSSSAGYGDGVLIEDCGAGRVLVDLEASLEAAWTWSGSDSGTRVSRFGVVKDRSDGVVLNGRIEGFAFANFYGDAAVDHSDGNGIHTFGAMEFHDGSYSTSDDGGARVRIGRGVDRRVALAAVSSCTLNGGPLLGAGKAAIYAVQMPGVAELLLAPGGTALENASLGRLSWYSDDISTPGPGRKASILAISDVNGRDARLYFEVMDHQGGDNYHRWEVTSSQARQVSANQYFPGSSAYSFGSGTIALSADTLYAVPFHLNLLAQGLAVEITSGVAGAGRLGLYGSTRDGAPGDLIEELSSTIDTSSVALQPKTFGYNRRLGGPLWLVALFNSAPTIRGLTVNAGAHAVFGRSTISSTTVTSYVTAAQAYGALPSVFPSATIQTGTTAPGIAVRAV